MHAKMIVIKPDTAQERGLRRIVRLTRNKTLALFNENSATSALVNVVTG